MIFSLDYISKSLANYLAPYFPGLTFYSDPVQQALNCPCAFLQVKNTNVSRRIHNRIYREIYLDLTYLEDYNLVDLQQRYRKAAGILDGCMDSFPLSDGENSITLLAYNRQWRIDLDALHYNFVLHVQEDLAETGTPMQTMSVDQEVLDEIQNRSALKG